MTGSESTNRPAMLTFDEIADQVIPRDPAISPDGTGVAFVVASASQKGEFPESAIWLSFNGQPARRFTGGDAVDSEPKWSPDGKTLAFLSNRKDRKLTAIYLLPVDGGEAQRLGELEGALSSLEWSPDGTSLSVLRVDPDSDAEKKLKDDRDDPIVFEEDGKLVRLWLVNVAAGTSRCLTTATRNVWEYAWHSDGSQLVYVSTPLNTINSLFVMASLWRIPTSGGRSHLLSTFSPVASSPVVRTVDGVDVVVVAASVLRDDPSNALWSVPLAGGTPVKLQPDFEGYVYDMVADPTTADGLIVRSVDHVQEHYYRGSAADGVLEQITLGGPLPGGSIASTPSVSGDGETFAYTWSRSDAPTEVYVTSPGETPVAVTTFGEDSRDRLATAEFVTWSSTDGVEIEGTLIRPRDHDGNEPLPLLVQIHGGPSWQWEDKVNLSWHDWAQMMASRGWAVLLPNPRGSTGRGSAFEQLLIGDIGGGESHDVVSGVEAMVARGIADPERLAIGGWSWGGYLTAWTITQTSMFKAAVMGAGVANLVSDHAAGDIAEANMSYYPGHPYTHWDLCANRSPVKEAARVTTPTLILHGDADSRVHVTQGQEFHRALQVLGVPVRFVRYPREGHTIRERAHQIDLMSRLVDWLKTHVG